MKILDQFLEDVPFSSIRHSDKEVYVKEGFGATAVENWPVYSFFLQYLQGKEDAARKNFESWYADQLHKYSNVSKSKGGMKNGSLYSLIETRCGAVFTEASEECKTLAIKERVNDRLELLNMIKKDGYDSSKAERIEAVRKGGKVYLYGGHHRAALLFALGYNMLPRVLVFPNQFAYNLFTFVRNLKHGQIRK